VARRLSRLLADSTLAREHEDIMQDVRSRSAGADQVADTGIHLQHAYSLRCVPQILGPVHDTIAFCGRIVEDELNSVNDNPIVLGEAEATFHGGNFHGQYMAMASDYLNIALTEIGVLVERQVNRLLDPHLNGNLPPFLAHGEAGLAMGLDGAHYLATSIAAENLDLAAPSSVKSISANGGNQDIVSMGLTSARKSMALCENVATMMAVLAAACQQAAHHRDPGRYSHQSRRWHDFLAVIGGPYDSSFPAAERVQRIRRLIVEDETASLVHSLVHD
jgi:histidine ammonia-lyase/tyrosine ammonia-lyase